jgi:thiamine-phosphate pyrophosphorylase
MIQIRERDLSARDATQLATRAVAAAAGRALVLVNDRFDVALAAGAAGVHLTGRSLAPDVVRACVGTGCVVGVSTHSAEEARQAGERGADFVVCGPVYDTPSKRGLGAPIGIDGLARATAASVAAVLALGGVDTTSARAVRAAGAAGLAGIRVFQDAWRDGGRERLAEVVRALREEWSAVGGR